MHRNWSTWSLPVVILLALAAWSVHTGAQSPFRGLRGARPVVEAEQYSTLQSALDSLPDGGGIVRLPPGTFEIDRPLILRRDDVLIQGAGTATHIRNTNTNGRPALILRLDPPAEGGMPARPWRIHLSNFRITGNPQSGHGILAERVNEIYVEGVTVSEHGGNGIHLDHCYEDPRIVNSLITYNKGVGLFLVGCHDIIVDGNQFEENQDALHCIDSFNLCMTGNNLDDHLGHGVVIENTYGSVVSGNMIEECNGTAIILDRDCYGDTLSANVIAHNGAGIDLRDAHGCAVSANTFTLMKTDALRIGPGSGRITVTGNNFSNSYLGDGRVKRTANDLAAAGLVLEGASHVSITGNVFSGLNPKGVTSDGSSRGIVFAYNVLVDAPSDHEGLDGIVEGNLIGKDAE